MNDTRRTVLYCENNTDGTIGGSHYCLLNLVENLDRSQFEPLVLFYEQHALVPRFRAAAQTMVMKRRTPARWGQGSSGQGRSMLALPLVIARRAVNFAKATRTVIEQVAFLRRHRIDLVHLNNSITRQHDWMIASLMAGVPCLTHERGINERYTFLDRALGRKLEHVIAISQWVRDHMVERGVPGDNIRVMYDGLNPESLTARRTPAEVREEWGVRQDQPIVGIVGNIRAWKGQETVVRAITEVVKTHPATVCFFVGVATPGDQPYLDKLKQLIRDASIEPNIRFTGYQSDVPSIMNTMDIVLHASVKPEPFGMVVLEAMAQRKAVVGSRAGGVIEMVVDGETGYTYPPGDWQSLATLINQLLSDPAAARRMGESGYRRLASSFSLRRYMNEIETMYRAVLSKRSLHSEIGLPSDTRAR